jgi:DNA-directed RNA polymerase subunit RPC12/RpoP
VPFEAPFHFKYNFVKYKTMNNLYKCPRCGSDKVVRILYGLPTAKGRIEAEAGRIALGGCVVTDNAPQYQCIECKEKITRLEERDLINP